MNLGILFGILSMLSWGSADFFAKLLVDRIGPYRALIYSYVFGVIPLIIWYLFFPMKFTMTFFIVSIMLLGVLFNALGYIFLYKAIELEKISLVSPIVATNPIIIVILGLVLLNEIITIPQAIGIILAVTGLVLISMSKKKVDFTDTKGIILGFSTMIMWGLAIFMIGYIVKLTHWLFAALWWRLLTWVFSLLTFKVKRFKLKLPKFSLLWLLIIVGVLDMCGTVLYNAGVSIGYISIIGPVAALFPVVTVVLAGIFLKEKLYGIQKSGVGLILIALVFLSI